MRTFWVMGMAAASGILSASTLTVPGTQSSIQAAINAAANGDTVLVAPGAYRENIDFAGKAITVTSQQGPAVTIIDGGAAGPVVKFSTLEGRNSVLSGFTLQNGAGSSGGGILIKAASPVIQGNVITNNAGCSGAGISINGGSPLVQGNTISGNFQSGCSGGVGGAGISIVSAGAAEIRNNVIERNTLSSANGGGISLFAAGSPTIAGNFIRNNTAAGLSPCAQGGGISMVNQSDALVVNNVIAANSAGCGGGIYWLVPSGNRGPWVVNNTLDGNAAAQGSAIYAGGFQSQALLVNNVVVSPAAAAALLCDTTYSTAPPATASNDVFAPSGVAYAGSCAGLNGVSANISADPLFAAPGSDYHLLPLSPAIDSGTSNQAPATDIEGTPRPLDGNGDGTAAFDMGAYEAKGVDKTPPVTIATASPLPAPADWNNTSVSVTLSATDSGSGVKQIQYSLTGAQTAGPVIVQSSSTSFTVTAEGRTTVGYFATDGAGNVESTKLLVLSIDKTAPVISGMPAAGCTLSPAKHQLVQVAVVTASDALSGVASLKVSATSNQPDSGTGGGDVPGDIVINGGTVQLRAEQSPGLGTRIYTITAVAADVAGNLKTATATCTVAK